jgi:hypothetical protein
MQIFDTKLGKSLQRDQQIALQEPPQQYFAFKYSQDPPKAENQTENNTTGNNTTGNNNSTGNANDNSTDNNSTNLNNNTENNNN